MNPPRTPDGSAAASARTEDPAARRGPNALTRVAQLGAWLGIVILVLYMSVGEGSGWYGVYSVDLRIFSLASLVVVFACWALAAWRVRFWRPRSVLWPVIVAILAAWAIATAASWRPRLSMDYAAYAAILAGLYLLLQRLLASRFFAPRLYTLAALLCAGISAWYLWTVLGLWTRWWSLVGRLAIPPLRPGMDGLGWGSPNTVAIMVILLLPPVLAFVGAGTMRRRIGLTGLTLLTAATVFVTGSRGAWLGLAVGLAVTTSAWLAVAVNRRALRAAAAVLVARRWPAAILAVGGLGGAFIAGPLIAGRVGGGGEDLRAGLVANALRQFQTSPLTGDGPGIWVVRRIPFTMPTEADYYIPYAHNIFAQTLAEFGLVGLVAGVVLIIWLAALIRDGARDPDPARRRFAWASLFSTVYFGAHQLVDLYVGLPCVLFAFALTIGYLDATATRSVIRGFARLPAAAGRIAVASLAVAIVGAIGFLAWSESAALPGDRAVEQMNAGDWSGALATVNRAEAADPEMPAYAFIGGLAALNSGDAAQAVADLERSVTADDFPQGWLNLAVARVVLGDAAGARDALARALRLGRQQASVAFGVGSVYAALGDEPAALDAFALAITVAPTLARDPALPHPAAVLAAAEATWAPTAWDSALLAGDVAEARVRVSRLPAGDQVRARLIIQAWAGDAGARQQLAAAAVASPTDVGLVAWNARLARQAGDTASADRYRQWADLVTPGGGDLALDLVSTPGNSLARGYGSIDATVYGLYAYRRPMPRDLLARSLPQLHLQ